ncbi:MAG: glycosyltransferase family 39 protein [Acidobacteria bacterium]|nr:glycosyltransferase family 39 protein [Acidobacteriota bacterium]
MEAAIGFLVVSYACFALSLAGLADPVSFGVLFFVLALLGALELRRITFSTITSRVTSSLREARFAYAIPLIVAGLAYTAWVYLSALLPATGIDELTYHLEVPRRILENGGATVFPDNVRAYFPQFGEMLFLYGMAHGGELGAKLYHALFAILLALALYGFSRQYVSWGFALLASALFLSVPSVMVISSWAYVDLHFALFGFLALVALLRYFQERNLSWALAAGIMAGGAWATKYTGLQLLLLLALMVLIEQLRGEGRRLPVAAMATPAVAFCMFLPYALRNWVETGWPLYPFNVGYLALNPEMNWDPERARLLLAWLSGFGSSAGQSLVDVLVAPVLVFLTAGFNDIAAYDGFVGPAFLLVPVLWMRGTKPRDARLVGLFCLLFLLYWTVTTRQVRFLIPVLPALCFLLAVGLSNWRSKFLTALIIVLILVNLGVGVHQVLKLDPWAFWTGRESREEYLTRRVSGYPLYQAANRLLGPEDRVFLVNMRNFGYLLDCNWRADFVFQHFTLGEALESASSASDIEEYFRSRVATHLMIDEGLTLTPQALDLRQRTMLETFVREHGSLVARNPLQPGQSLWQLRDD